MYIGLPAREELLDLIVDELTRSPRNPERPAGSTGCDGAADRSTHILYLNLDGDAKQIDLKGRAKSILHDQEYENGFVLGPDEPEFVELRSDSSLLDVNRNALIKQL